MSLVWVLRVAAVATMAGGIAVQAILCPGTGAGSVPLMMQVLYLVGPGLTVLGLAEAHRLQLEARGRPAVAGQVAPAGPPALGYPAGRLWLAWRLRGLAGLLLAGMILKLATNVMQGITPMIAAMMASSYLGLAARAVGAAEILRVQLAPQAVPSARSRDDETGATRPQEARPPRAIAPHPSDPERSYDGQLP